MPPSPAPAPAPAMSATARRVLMSTAIVAAALLAYHNSLRGALVLDDQGNILDNPSIRQLWPPSWFAAPVEAGVAGRPFANFTYAINYAASGTAGWSYHGLNLVLHTLSALVLCGLVRRTLLWPALRARFGAASTPLALATALLWLVHPLTTAAVDYLSQRTELLAALCQLLTLYGFVRSAESASLPWNAVAVAACALGMASKETTIVLPWLVLLYDRTFVGGTFRDAWRARRSFYCGFAALWLVLAALMVTSRLAERGVGFGLGVAWLDYALTAGGAQLRYLWLAQWPSPLVFDYGWALAQPSLNTTLACLGLVALIAGAAVAGARRQVWALAAIWFFLLLAPSTVVPIIQQPIAESRAYLPLAGVVTLAVLVAYAAFGRRVWSLFAGIAALFCVLTAQRNQDYADAIGLWTDTLAKRPDNARAHGNLAAALLAADRPEEALAHSLRATRLSPNYADAYTNSGAALVRLGRPEEALPHLETALRLRPTSPAAEFNFANALLRAGQVEPGVAHLETALRLDPRQVAAHNDLSVALLQLGRVADAIGHAVEATRLAPALAEAHYNLGNALVQAGRLTEAIDQFIVTIRLKPTFDRAHHNLGAVLLRSGRAAEAIGEFETTLRLNPAHPDARRNLELARRAAAR